MTTIDQNQTTRDSSAGGRRPRIVVLSSSLLTDRMLMHTHFRQRLSAGADVQLWTMSASSPNFVPPELVDGCEILPLPAMIPFKQFPYNYARRMNEAAWDFAQKSPSRASIRKHIPNRWGGKWVQATTLPGRLAAMLGLQQPLEDWVERLCLSYPRSPEAVERLKAFQPDLVVATGPHRYEEPAIVAAAKNLDIPVITLITSWDNLSTKNRMVFKYDGYLVWSEHMERELAELYPQTRGLPVYRVGAPQFDALFDERFKISKEEFCAANRLRPDRPIILHTLGSPNFTPGEVHAAYYMAERVARGDLGEAQLLVRPHPLFEVGDEEKSFAKFGPRVVVQRTGQAFSKTNMRSQNHEQIIDWVNSFRYCDVMVNLFSTVAVDAAILDKPVVNLDYDPGPGQPWQEMIKDVNHVWSHFKPITESGGMWTVQNNEEMFEAVKGYLADPSLHRARRRWIAEFVAGYIDGRCGERMGEAVLDFARTQAAVFEQAS